MRATDWFPRIKPEHEKVRLPNGDVRIGGFVRGIAAEVTDDDGSFWSLLCAADGSRTCQEVATHVVASHGHLDEQDVLAMLEQLVEAGYVDNARAADPPSLTEREKERYDRGRLLFRWMDLQPRESSWEPQLQLKMARVVVLGLGGTGGALATALAQSGVGELHCLDADFVELSNLNRQAMYTEDHIGKPKVDVAVDRLRRINSDIIVIGEQRRVTGEDDLEPLVRSCDLFVLCADEPADIRTWVNRVCLRNDTPWVEAGYNGPLSGACAYVPGVGGCYECGWLAEHEQHKKVNPHKVYSTERTGPMAVSAPSAALSGYLAAHLVLALLTGAPEITPGRHHGINLVDLNQHFVIDSVKRPDCPACGSHEN